MVAVPVSDPSHASRLDYASIVYVPHLFADQDRVANISVVLPFGQEQFAEKGIEGLFLTAELLASSAILLM